MESNVKKMRLDDITRPEPARNARDRAYPRLIGGSSSGMQFHV
jgi:hypothetical protein